MRTGGSVPWWSAAAGPVEDDMTYECDAKLGSPKEVDCAHIEWAELGADADADAVELVPGVVKTLASSRYAAGGSTRANGCDTDTCNVALRCCRIYDTELGPDSDGTRHAVECLRSASPVASQGWTSLLRTSTDTTRWEK